MNEVLEYPAFLGEFPVEPDPWTDCFGNSCVFTNDKLKWLLINVESESVSKGP